MRFDHAALLEFCRWLAELDAREWLREQEQLGHEQSNPDAARDKASVPLAAEPE